MNAILREQLIVIRYIRYEYLQKCEQMKKSSPFGTESSTKHCMLATGHTVKRAINVC